MLFSVTLPTALHLAYVAVLALVFLPRLAGRSVGHWLDGMPSQIFWARNLLALLAGVSASVVAWLAWQMVVGSPHLLNGFIGFFDSYHQWLLRP